MRRWCWSLAVSSTDDPTGARAPAVETYVVGSLPRPRWLFDVMEQQRSGTLSAAEAECCMDEAIVSAIRLQERAGLDVVSDGEWRRRYFSTVVADRIGGCEYRRIPGRPAFLPVVVGRIAGRGPIARHEAAYLSARASDHPGVRRGRSGPSRRSWRVPGRQETGVRAIARANDDEETLPVVEERIERALRFLPPERLTVNPDCGLAPTAQRTPGSTLDDAYDRLAMLCTAARAVRETKPRR